MSDFEAIAKELLEFEVLGHAPLDALLKLVDRHRGNQNLDRTARGRLLHPGGAPIAGLDVELWDEDLGSQDDFLGLGTTDADGRFEIAYSRRAAGLGDKPDLTLRIYEPPQTFTVDGRARSRRILIDKIKGARDVDEADYDMGGIELPFYEYDSNVAFPYTSKDSLRRDFVPGAAERFFKSLGTWGAVHDKIVLRLRLGAKLTTAEVQAHYPKTKTTLMEESEKGSSRSDAYFGKRILDGFFPAQLKRRAGDEDGYHLAFQWSAFALNEHIDLPDMACRFELRDGQLLPTEITLRFRKAGELAPGGAYDAPMTFTSNDGPKWAEAKRVFRTLYFGIVGQLYGHVAIAHFNMEQYAISMNRNLRRSPLRQVLMPHLKEVSNINDKGRTLLLGAKDGLFARAKPIELESQLAWLTSNVGRHDWFGFQPRAPICEGHVYAKAAGLYWEALHEHLDAFFAEHHDAIVATWSEVQAFEADILRYSVPFVARGMEETGDLEPIDVSEISRPHDGRVSRDGVVLAVTPFLDGGGPTEAALRKLAQVCAYCIFHTTFLHGWFHTAQNDEFGEILYAQMGTNGSLAPEDDPAILPGAELESLGLRTTHSLTGFDWGFLLKNEDGDVPASLIAAVEKRRQAFVDAGYDPATLRSRLNS